MIITFCYVMLGVSTSIYRGRHPLDDLRIINDTNDSKTIKLSPVFWGFREKY